MWGFILSLLALLLMYPVGVLVNWTTPLIKDRWAKRSQAALKNRIFKLEAEIKAYSGTEVFSPFQNIVMTAFKTVFLLILTATHSIIWAVAQRPIHLWSGPYVGMLLMTALCLYYMSEAHNSYRARYRRQNERRLALLREKLI
jgi:hypothetical protein